MFLLLPDIKVWMPETTRGLLPHNVVWYLIGGNAEISKIKNLQGKIMCPIGCQTTPCALQKEFIHIDISIISDI